MTIDPSARETALGRVLWDYPRISAALERREAIVAFGGHDLRVAEWAAQLWLDGWAPKLVLSGGLGYYTRKIWSQPEAHKFRQIAVDKGVDAGAIFVEDQSCNTGENVAFRRKLLETSCIVLRRAICVQKPYLERRVHLTLLKQWPGCEFVLSSPPIPYQVYTQPDIIGFDRLINELVGQLDRAENIRSLASRRGQRYQRRLSSKNGNWCSLDLGIIWFRTAICCAKTRLFLYKAWFKEARSRKGVVLRRIIG